MVGRFGKDFDYIPEECMTYTRKATKCAYQCKNTLFNGYRIRYSMRGTHIVDLPSSNTWGTITGRRT